MIPPIESLTAEIAKNIKGVLFDIDDTFSLHGKIPTDAFQAIWTLKAHGMKVIPVTGRPAGWCDHIARMWPVDGVVGENGAFYFWLDETEQKLKKHFMDPEDVRTRKRERLILVKEEILDSVPGTALASDQLYRETDLAIDYCEDVAPLGWDAIDMICKIFQKHGATCKVSSIHVNGWFGDYTKLHMTKIFVKDRWGIELDKNRDKFIFCGDSPNDEPMFQYFPYTVGVKNVLRFSDKMKHHPAFLANRQGGEGFAETMSYLLRHLK